MTKTAPPLFSLVRFILLGSALALICAPSVAAQSADKIIKQAVKAMTSGKGEQALRNVKAWQVKGTIKRLDDDATGSYQAAAKWPNLYTEAFDLRGLETAIGYNGKSGWRRDAHEGLRTLTGPLSRDLQTEANYRNARWLDYKKDKAKLTLAEPIQINGKPSHTVVLTTPKNVKLKLYFDAQSYLLVREELPAGELVRVFDYSDFRAVDNVMEPHTISLTSGAQRYEIKLDQVVHNPALDRALFEFPQLSNEPLPDIQTLLKEVREHEDELDRLLEKYTYTETVTSREIDNKGQAVVKETETFERTFYKGNRIRRLVAKNGQPLSTKEQADEQQRIEKRIREIEKREAEKEKQAARADDNEGPPSNERSRRISIADVLRASRLLNPRRERFRGRDCVVFDFEPLPGYKPQKSYEKFFGKMAGALWIDVADKQVARVEARLVDSYKIGGGVLASLREGASFVLEQDRINNEIWLPTRTEINLGVKVLMVKGINVNETIVYGDYKRFNVEAEKEKLKDPAATEKSAKP